MGRFVLLLICGLWAVFTNAETVTLYNDNGQGGIHQSTGKLIIEDGQYYVDLAVPTYGGNSKIEHLKVYRVRDDAGLLYRQDKWAEKYTYVVERSNGFYSSTPYYFNMKSPWRPSLTEDPSDPNFVRPIKKMFVYKDDYQGNKVAIKVVLIEKQGKYMLYYGDDFFGALIEPNTNIPNYAPIWAHDFDYCATISGFTVYFNLN
ncbi:MAG: hypothetical protein K2I64_07265 [Muribaculaceae bacterium]|nr:hypothetical protein [Muribaculaceae bacterium]